MRKVVGHHAIREVLKIRPKSVKELWLLKGWESSSDLREIANEFQKMGLKPQPRSKEVLDQLSMSHQGCVAVVSEDPEFKMADLDGKESAVLLYLDHIEDPQNLGSILRTAWLMGVQGIWIPKVRAAPLTPSVHKVAAGGAEHVPVTEIANPSQLIKELKERDFWVLGLSHRAKSHLFQVELPPKVLFCVGAEERGIRSTTERDCDEMIRIPQTDSTASFNAGVSAAIALTVFRFKHRFA